MQTSSGHLPVPHHLSRAEIPTEEPIGPDVKTIRTTPVFEWRQMKTQNVWVSHTPPNAAPYEGDLVNCELASLC